MVLKLKKGRGQFDPYIFPNIPKTRDLRFLFRANGGGPLTCLKGFPGKMGKPRGWWTPFPLLKKFTPSFLVETKKGGKKLEVLKKEGNQDFWPTHL